MGNKKQISDLEIKVSFNKLIEGEMLKDVVAKLGISRQAFDQRITLLNLNLSEELNKKEVKEIKNIDNLCSLIKCKREDILPFINREKSNEQNLKRFNYLKNNSPVSFNKEVINIIVKYNKIDAITLIKLVKEYKEKVSY